MIHTGGVLALVTLLVASGAGVTYALWTASISTTSVAKSGSLTVATAFANSGNSVFENQKQSLTVNGTVTVTNTTPKDGALPVSTQLSASISGADAAMRNNFTVRAWPAGPACDFSSPPTNPAPVQGTWAQIAPLSASLARNASVTYCVSATVAERGDLGVSGGTFTITPQATATASLTGTFWTTSAAATVTQTTRHIYPRASFDGYTWYRISDPAGTNCVDVEADRDADAVRVIGFGCKSTGTTNQRWRLTADGAYYRIISKQAGARSAVVTGASTAVGGGITTSATSGDEGLWQAQQIASGAYQLVSKASGLCLTRGTQETATVTLLSQQLCAALPSQSFNFTADGSTIVQGPAVIAGPSAAINPNARYEIKTPNSQCIAANNANLTMAGCANWTQWRLTPAASGSYYISMAEDSTTNAGSRWYVSTANTDVRLGTSTNTGSGYRWTPVASGSGYQLRSGLNSSWCLNSALNVANCSSGVKVDLVMINNPNPVAAPLSCVPANWEAVYSWPRLTGYQNEVKYRAYIGTTLVAASLGGSDSLRINNGNAATLAMGMYTVTVEQSVAGRDWTTVGTSLLEIVSSNGGLNSPYKCGVL